MGDVADGMGAQAAYFEQIDPEIIGIQKEIRLTEMKEYCKADTRGLMHFMDCMESANEPVSFGDGNLFGVA
jgi:3-hydroxy-3-methylglutaryl CoA synthase